MEKNKIFWITGASSGIGKALAIFLNDKGYNIILSSRNKEKLDQVKSECLYPDKAKILVLDLENYHNLQQIVQNAINLFGKIDVLINNGGISQRSLVKDTNIQVDEKIMKINYFGTVALSKAILPHFIQNKNGHFVTVTSVVGKIGTPLRSSYAASKHALHGFFDSLRAEVYKDNIKVTLICPGFVQTNVSINALIGDGSSQNTMDKATANGLKPNFVAKKIHQAILKNKEEVVIGGKKEKFSVLLKRFYPKLLSKLVRKISVT
ncbi:MAG TPA: SDR family oxidoreductase [Flavobacteriia bacterium]|nr:SDR family oxidoreductase [Flavobacteriia bacterium]